MGIGYQFTDRRSFDYELWYSDELKMALRGPRAICDPAMGFWSFVGAAQTFGRFADKPFPALVSSWMRKQHLNLGFAGAGPDFFANSQPLLQKINESELCFLQIMSGRSVSTNLLRAIGFGGVLEFTAGPLAGKRFLAAEAYRKLMQRYGKQPVADQISEARTNWTNAYRSLIEAIKVPIVCIWISSRSPQADPVLSAAGNILGDFPHLITPRELDIFRQYGLELVGGPLMERPEQLLVNFTTRQPVDVYDAAQFESRADWSRAFNTYYPTPEMHLSVATDIFEQLAARGTRRGTPAPLEWRAATAAARMVESRRPAAVHVSSGSHLRRIVDRVRQIPVLGKIVQLAISARRSAAGSRPR